MKRIIALFFSVIFCISVVGCNKTENGNEVEKSDIVVLFTNDIHGSVDEGNTLSGVSYYKKEMEKKCRYVTMVDCGDAVQGSYLTSVSSGQVLVDAMNIIGYDYAILGNHEFDYGIARLNELTSLSNAQYLCCNITYSGSQGNGIQNIKPYEIKTFGDIKVAFVGVTTPRTLTESRSTFFMEGEQTVFDFAGGETADAVCACVQTSVDAARAEGADYVICLAHLGIEEDSVPFTSTELAKGTNGIDAILDGHSHNLFQYFNHTNKDGKSVLIAQTGTNLEGLGQLVITADGLLTVSVVSDIAEKDAEIDGQLQEILDKYNEQLQVVCGSAAKTLSVNDEEGFRAVRNRETAIGNFVSDAVRVVSDAEISFINGGSIRADLKEGDVTYADLISIFPFANTLYTIEVTGAELADMLEYVTCKAKSETVDTKEGKAVGEMGSFPNMSGISFTLDTTIEPTGIEIDEEENLIRVTSEKRRVSDIKVLQNGEYVPIDPAKTYKMATSDYVAIGGGSGMLHFFANHKTENVGILDYEALKLYITDYLKGDLSSYNEVAGRINFIR